MQTSVADARGDDVTSRLTDRAAAESFEDLPLEELCHWHHDLVCRLRDVDHWRRLISARLDLAVAAVTDLDEPAAAGPAGGREPLLLPPGGLRELLGIARREERLFETALLPLLRQALAELDTYSSELRDVTDQAERALAVRLAAGSQPA